MCRIALSWKKRKQIKKFFSKFLKSFQKNFKEFDLKTMQSLALVCRKGCRLSENFLSSFSGFGLLPSVSCFLFPSTFSVAAMYGEPVKAERREKYRWKALSFIYLYLYAKFRPPSCNTKEVINGTRDSNPSHIWTAHNILYTGRKFVLWYFQMAISQKLFEPSNRFLKKPL